MTGRDDSAPRVRINEYSEDEIFLLNAYKKLIGPIGIFVWINLIVFCYLRPCKIVLAPQL